MIENLAQTAALLLSAFLGSESTELEKMLHSNNDENNDDGDTKRNSASLYANLLLPLSGILSNNPHTPQVTVEEMELNERKADALYEYMVNMDDIYSQKPSPKSRERKDLPLVMELVMKHRICSGTTAKLVTTRTAFRRTLLAYLDLLRICNKTWRVLTFPCWTTC